MKLKTTDRHGSKPVEGLTSRQSIINQRRAYSSPTPFPGASIILNGSIAPTVGIPNGAGFYAASKGGLHAMSRSMAGELAPRGIRINVVAPGFIQTPMWERVPLPPMW